MSAVCEAQGKGKGRPRKVTQRSKVSKIKDKATYGSGEVVRGKKRCVGSI